MSWGRLAGGAGVAGLAALAYGLWEARQYQVRVAQVPVLTSGTQPLRVLHLSDLHLAPQDRDRIAWLRGLRALDPDLVIVTGDFIAHERGVGLVAEALAPFIGVPGAFVFGSNDYFGPLLRNPFRYLRDDFGGHVEGAPLPTQDLRDFLTSMGWHDLNNRRASLTLHDTRIDLRGVDDPHIERDDYSQIAGAVDLDAALTIGVAHAPYVRVLDAMTADGVDLILAGHTHGGQVCLPIYGTLTANCDLDRHRARGLSRHGGAYLHVSAGVGTSPFTPVRVACRPEATLLAVVPG